MDPLTHHHAFVFHAERATYDRIAHWVDGVGYVGGAGLRLEDALRHTWHREADVLLADLEAIAGALAQLGPSGLEDALTLAGRTQQLVDDLDKRLTDRTGEGWTFDGPNGGRPITGDTPTVDPPPAPVLVVDGREASDHGTDDDTAATP